MSVKLSILDRNEPKKNTAALYLQQEGGTVALRFEDASGDDWVLAYVRADGHLARAASVPDGLGFEVDEEGRILLGDVHEEVLF